MKTGFKTLMCAAGLAAAGLWGAATAPAQLVWDGGVNGTWDVGTTANWSGGNVFNNGDAVLFDDTASGSTTITVAAGGVLPGGMTVNNSSLAYSIGGGPIGGTGDLIKQGTGALTLTGANSFSGGTRIEAGTVTLGNNSALGTGPVTMAGGTLRPGGSTITLANSLIAENATTSNLLDSAAGGAGDLILTGPVSGGGTLVINSTTSRSLWFQGDPSAFAGTIAFTNNNNGTNLRLGGTGTGANSLTNGSDFSQASFVLSGSTTANRGLMWNGLQGATVQLGSLSGTGRIIAGADGRTANWEIGGLGLDTSYSGVIEGAGTSLTKVGPGNLTLSGVSNYGGGTTLTGGTLTVANGSALGTGPLTLAGGILSAAGGSQGLNMPIIVQDGTTTQLLDNLSNVDLVLRGAITGTGTLVLDSTQSRSLWLMGDASGFGGTIAYNNNNDGTNLRLGGGPGTGQNNDTNASDFSGTRFVLSGSTGSNRGLSWNGLDGATVQLGSIEGTGRIGLPNSRAANWEVGGLGLDTTYSGTIEGAGSSLTKVGPGNLTLTNTLGYGGPTTVSGGTLTLAGTPAFPGGGGATGQFSSAQTIQVEPGATLAVTGQWALGGGLAHAIHVDGGTLQFLNSDNYQGNISLTGGAITTSGGLRPWRTGNWGSGQITVNASPDTSTISGSLAFVGTAAAPVTRFTVADGPAAIDLLSNALIFDHPGFEGQMQLVKDGPGLMQLAAASTWSGGTVISEGTVVVTNTNALGTGAVTLNDADTGAGDTALLLGSALTLPNAITVSSLGTGVSTIGTIDGNPGPNNSQFNGLLTLERDVVLQAGSTDRTTFFGNITGTGDVIITSPFANHRRIVFDRPSGTANDWDGNLILMENSRLQLGVANSIGNRTIPDQASITFHPNSILRLTPTGTGDSETVGSLISTAAGAGNITMDTGDAFTLRFGADNQDATYAGTFNNGGAQFLTIEKVGSGIQTFTGSGGNLKGGVLVSEGTLRLQGNRGFNDGWFAGVNDLPYTIADGARLELAGDWVTRSNSIYNINGGTIAMVNPGGGDINYINRLNFDVAPGTIEGTSGFRSGFFFEPEVNVTAAASGSQITTGWRLFSNAGGPPNRLLIDVADGAAAHDLTVSGRIVFDPSHPGMAIVKTGDGVLRLTDPTNNFNGGLRIEGGTVSTPHLAGGNNQSAIGAAPGIAANLVFDGGALEYTGPTVGGINRAFTLEAGGGRIRVSDPATTLTWTDAAGAGPITGPGAFIKDGPGALVFAGSNNYTGGTTVREGSLIATNGGAFGSGAVTLNDADTGGADTALLLGVAATLPNAITVSSLGTGTTIIGSTSSTVGANRQFDGTLTLERDVVLQAGSTDRTTFAGQITGTGDVIITSPFTEHRRIVFDRPSGTANDWDGNLILMENSRLQLGVANSIGNRTIPDQASITFHPNSILRLTPTGTGDSETVGSLISTAAGAGNIFMDTGIDFTLRFGADNEDAVYAGSITDGGGQALALDKVGTGTQTIAGTAAHSGPTTVSAGTLDVAGSITNSPAVVVLPDGRLSGTGSISSPVSVQGGTLAPGYSTAFGLGSLTLAGALDFASTWEVNLDGPDAGLLVLNGPLNASLSDITLAPGPLFNPIAHNPYWLLDNRGGPLPGDQFANMTATSPFAALYPTASGFVDLDGLAFAVFLGADFDTGGLTGGNDIVLFAVPEPGRALLLAMALAGMLIRRRR